MVSVYLTDIRKLPDPLDHPEVMNRLTSERRNVILQLKKEKSRKQSLGAGLLLNRIFAERGLSAEDIVRMENGKLSAEGIEFNIAHSDDLVVCVTSDKPVGCDIEKIGVYNVRLAERHFTENEFQYLNHFAEDDKAEMFCRIWTMKESYLKMTGEGLRVKLDRIDFELDHAVKVYRDGKLCSCFIKEYEITNYKLTVCAKENCFADNLEWIEF